MAIMGVTRAICLKNFNEPNVFEISSEDLSSMGRLTKGSETSSSITV